MVEINWTPLALDQLKNVCDYIGKYNPQYGKKLLNRIDSELETLKDLSRIGRIVPDDYFNSSF